MISEKRQEDLERIYTILDVENQIAFLISDGDQIEPYSFDEEPPAYIIQAYCFDEDKEKHVGLLEVGQNGFLKHVGVHDSYLRKGIGTKLIQLAIEHCGLRHVACMRQHEAYRYGLTIACEHLISACVRKSIITNRMCIFPNSQAYFDTVLILKDPEEAHLTPYTGSHEAAFATGDYQNDPKLTSEIIAKALLAKHHQSQKALGEKGGASRLVQTTLLLSKDLNTPLFQRPPVRSASPLPAFVKDNYHQETDEEKVSSERKGICR